ncbi:hypothetical protein [Streptacidiphilus cavernicola]|uniref:Sodium:proline symporter n=1 Tax=Streptacidiphilus cavernicola TaxID=3342716 RepID=A0ABV6VVI5_9ACTN
MSTTTVAVGAVLRSRVSRAELVRGAVSGLVAGLMFAGATMWFLTSIGKPADTPLLMISTLVKGDGAMMNGTASVPVGLVVHMVLSLAFGMVFAVLTARIRTNGLVAVAGVAYGGLLYVLNFQVLARAAFHTFSMADQPFELVVHLVFGVLLAFALYNSGARSSGRPAATS